MVTARYPVHQMIQDLMRNAGDAAAFAENPEQAFDRYALLEEERQLLRDGSPAALHQLGVHPNLQMKLRKLRSPPPRVAKRGPLAAYLDRLLER